MKKLLISAVALLMAFNISCTSKPDDPEVAKLLDELEVCVNGMNKAGGEEGLEAASSGLDNALKSLDIIGKISEKQDVMSDAQIKRFEEISKKMDEKK